MNIYEKLYDAIKEHCELEDDSIIDAGNYGADGGFNGFIYNSDCIEFYDNNYQLIFEFSQKTAEDFGYKNWMDLYSNFGRSDMLELQDGHKILGAWFVLEEVGRWLDSSH